MGGLTRRAPRYSLRNWGEGGDWAHLSRFARIGSPRATSRGCAKRGENRTNQCSCRFRVASSPRVDTGLTVLTALREASKRREIEPRSLILRSTNLTYNNVSLPLTGTRKKQAQGGEVFFFSSRQILHRMKSAVSSIVRSVFNFQRVDRAGQLIEE